VVQPGPFGSRHAPYFNLLALTFAICALVVIFVGGKLNRLAAGHALAAAGCLAVTAGIGLTMAFVSSRATARLGARAVLIATHILLFAADLLPRFPRLKHER